MDRWDWLMFDGATFVLAVAIVMMAYNHIDKRK